MFNRHIKTYAKFSRLIVSGTTTLSLVKYDVQFPNSETLCTIRGLLEMEYIKIKEKLRKRTCMNLKFIYIYNG